MPDRSDVDGATGLDDREAMRRLFEEEGDDGAAAQLDELAVERRKRTCCWYWSTSALIRRAVPLPSWPRSKLTSRRPKVAPCGPSAA